MPHQVRIESNAKGVVISFSDVVSGDEIIALNGRLISDVSFSKCRYQVWNFLKATRLEMTIEEIDLVTKQDAAGSVENQNLKIALVGQKSFFGGRDRIFQILEEVWTGYEAKVFLDVEAALEWAASNDGT